MRSDLYRTLRDVRDGHITLYVQVARYDPSTGQPTSAVEIETSPDRAPAGNELRSSSCWWRILADRGWLRLPTESEPQMWMLTDTALDAVASKESQR